MVELYHVNKDYGRGNHALVDINLAVEKGDFVFLTGASGAGKTTLLRLLFREEIATSGKILVDGMNVSTLPSARVPRLRRRIGVVFQDFRLLDHLSALDNVALPLRVAGAREELVRSYVAELLAWVGLADHIHALPPTLSGGQQQRVAIARAVISRPSLLLADEPTGNVDDGIGVRLMYLFDELNKLGTTVMIATHNENLVARFRHPQLRIENLALRLRQPETRASA